MGRVWRGLLEAACFVGFAFAENYRVLCLVTANGELALFHSFVPQFARHTSRQVLAGASSGFEGL